MKELELYINSFDSDRTKSTYLFNIKRWFDYQKIDKIEDIKKLSAIDIDFYIDDMKRGNLSESSIYSYSIAVKGFIDFLYTRKIIKENIFSHSIKRVKTKREQKYLNTNQSIDFLKSLKKDFDKAIFYLAIDTGLRFSEIKNIKKADIIELENGAYIDVLGKGGKNRVVGFSKKTLNCIKEYLKNRKVDSDYLFCSSKGNALDVANTNKSLKRKLKKCGFCDYKDFHMHSLRHTFASVRLENGENLKVIAEQMGHSSISTTENYLHIDKSKQGLSMIENSLTSLL